MSDWSVRFLRRRNFRREWAEERRNSHSASVKFAASCSIILFRDKRRVFVTSPDLRSAAFVKKFLNLENANV